MTCPALFVFFDAVVEKLDPKLSIGIVDSLGKVIPELKHFFCWAIGLMQIAFTTDTVRFLIPLENSHKFLSGSKIDLD